MRPVSSLYRTFPEPSRVPPSLLRGNKANLVEVLPLFPNSSAPILFHLPSRTAYRVLETLPIPLISSTFICNGSVRFGLDEEQMRRILPRWKVMRERSVPIEVASRLAHLVYVNAGSIAADEVPSIIEITGKLVEDNLLNGVLGSMIVRQVLPRCLDQKQLSRQDLLRLVMGIRRIPITPENAVLFPMISNFASWYLARNSDHRHHRKTKHEKAKEIEKLLPPTSKTIRQIFS